MKTFVLTTVLAVSCATVRADFTYQQTAQMTGGALFDMMKSLGPLARQAREPMVTTTIVKGNRMATIAKDRITVTDLDKETITEIDKAKKTYSVLTFAQMKQQMEDAMARAQAQKDKAQAKQGGDSANVDANFSVSAKATGQTKTVSGMDAKEMLITMTLAGTDKDSGQSGAMNIITDSWMAKVAGYEEVQAFHRKMGEKMGYLFGSGMAQMGMMRPETLKGFEAVGKEMAKMDGVPVESTMKMTGQPGDTSPAQAPPAQGASGSSGAAGSSASSGVGASAAGAALGRLGLGGFGRKKNADAPPPQQQGGGDAPQGQAGSGSLMEMTTQMSGFSAGPADTSKFEVPAGYKQVESAAGRRGR